MAEATDAAFAGYKVTLANPPGIFILEFPYEAFSYHGRPLPRHWVRYSRGQPGHWQRLEVGPPNWENAFLDDIFDITDPASPVYLHAVRTDCGSHTHTLIPDLANGRLLIYVSSYAWGVNNVGGVQPRPVCLRRRTRSDVNPCRRRRRRRWCGRVGSVGNRRRSPCRHHQNT